MRATTTAFLAAAVLALSFVGVAAQDLVYDPGKDVTVPEVVKRVNARYTEEAKQNRIEGNVGLEVIVKDDGKVGDVKVTASLDTVYGLDQEAVKAMKQWEFKPGTIKGRPVAVRVHVTMSFSLR